MDKATIEQLANKLSENQAGLLGELVLLKGQTFVEELSYDWRTINSLHRLELVETKETSKGYKIKLTAGGKKVAKKLD